MKMYLQGQGLWQYVVEEKQPTQLEQNPKLNQIRLCEEKATKAPRALLHIYLAVSELMFIRIMACEATEEVWDKLKEEYGRSDKTKDMHILNLRRKLEMLKMQESKNVKEYVDRLMNEINKIRLLDEELTDKWIVENVLVSLPERFEAKTSSPENSKDFSQITLTEFVHALQAQQQRRLLRQENNNEGAIMASYKGKSIQRGYKNLLEREMGKKR
ncbi:uncharacterized protein LOC116139502 [Pistacia vera]|uniref:uncharacterized protein LOC116139502 n=1 Tax=Pistacia vera TaxID=55513 RepID=UPI001263BF35|nr:uncharacterized protein LOC116139502 [Pistacia vera]